MFEELRDLDAQCARALGLHVVIDYETVRGERVAVGWFIGEKDDENATSVLRYSTDSALTPILLGEIARRGRGAIYEYIYQLVSILEPRLAINKDMVVVSTGMAWLILTATPEQHARAFVKVTE